ncbi:MAG: GNAT family N-acetyltransferase [Crocinitomicaceae bacterium]|nr:GNAT family N-acetyltransferase [Crocinitomicaceae bacterium]
MKFEHQVKSFLELSLEEFHDIIALRIQIFIIEQNCPYQEVDGKDKLAHHLFFKNEMDEIIAVTRILPQGISYEEVAIGRVVVHEEYRGTGLGNQLMADSMNFVRDKYGEVPVRLSAQKHLENYYGNHGFKSTGKEYLEDGIPHVEMLYNI